MPLQNIIALVGLLSLPVSFQAAGKLEIFGHEKENSLFQGAY